MFTHRRGRRDAPRRDVVRKTQSLTTSIVCGCLRYLTALSDGLPVLDETLTTGHFGGLVESSPAVSTISRLNNMFIGYRIAAEYSTKAFLSTVLRRDAE